MLQQNGKPIEPNKDNNVQYHVGAFFSEKGTRGYGCEQLLII